MIEDRDPPRVDGGNAFDTVVFPVSSLPTTPAGRLAAVLELLTPVDECGYSMEPIISVQDALRLLESDAP